MAHEYLCAQIGQRTFPQKNAAQTSSIICKHLSKFDGATLHSNQEEAEKAQEAANIGSELYTSNIDVFNYAIYFSLFGDSLDELNRSTELVRTAAAQCNGARFQIEFIENESSLLAACLAWDLMSQDAAKQFAHPHCAIRSLRSCQTLAQTKAAIGLVSPKKH